MKNLVKAIVFDEFSNKAPKLTYILDQAKGQKQLTDKQIETIEKELGVRSFEEFLEKFAPTIYPVVTQDKIEWTLENNGEKGIKLNLDYKPLKILIDLMDKRENSNQSNLEFDWQDALQAILPSSMVEDAKYMRGQLENLVKKTLDLDKSNPEYKETILDIREKRKKIIEIYRDNPMNLLPLAINDCEEKIKKLGGFLPKNKNLEVSNTKMGYLKFDENGEVKFEEVTPRQIEYDKESKDNVIPKVQAILVKDYQDLVKSKNQEENSYIKNLIVNNFSNGFNQLVENINIEEIKEIHQTQVRAYKKHLQGSFDSLNAIFTKILGIKAFFDQGSKKESPMLIIANEKVTEIIKRKNLLGAYLGTIDRAKFLADSTLGANIWLGIIPGIITKTEIEEEIEFDIDDAIIVDEFDNEENNKLTSISAAKELISILSKYKIMTFFNIEANKENTFEEIQKKGIDNFKEEIENLKLEKSPYCVPCYPNFTVVDEKNFKVDIKTEDKDAPLYLKGIYIDSSYVATGLVAAYLEPENLIDSNKFDFDRKNINLTYPGVRINLEETEFSTKIRTSIAKESNFGIINKTKQDIRDFKIGFIFICNESLSTMFAFLCRSTDKKPIYRILTKDYISRLFLAITDGNDSKIKGLKNGIIREWEKEKDKKNVILKENDEIKITEEFEVAVKFENAEEERIELVVKELND